MDDRVDITLDPETTDLIANEIRINLYRLVNEMRHTDNDATVAQAHWLKRAETAREFRSRVEALCEFLNQANPEALDHDEATWQEHIGLGKA